MTAHQRTEAPHRPEGKPARWTTDQVADYLGVSSGTIRRWFRDNPDHWLHAARLKGLGPGTVRYSPELVEALGRDNQEMTTLNSS